MIYKKFAYLFIAVSLLGFLDATYLTVDHYRGIVPPCSIVIGCQIVTTSNYSLIFTIPVALLGSLYYLSILLLSITTLETKNDHWLRLAAWLTLGGLLASIWFVYIQWQILKAWCLYCLGSASTSTLLFIMAVLLLAHHKSWWERVKEKFKFLS